MDFNALRARTLGSGTDEEAVTVNTRALIDKVLARYSGEWTVLRELLQNAADASATRVTVKFETIPSATVPLPHDASQSNLLKHALQHHTLKRLVVSNNGQVFNENDWSRLKRIAEGNPDETKIGAFGVGFYSTFADCEEPFVSSGNQAMAFFWKSNSLFTRRLQLPQTESSSDTNFVLDYRDTTSSVPPLMPLAQFLASSLTFVGIESIELWLDEWNVMSLSKKTSPSQDVAIPRDIDTKTPDHLMKVLKVSKEVAQIDGQWMAAISWRPPQNALGRLIERDPAPSIRKFFSRLAGSAPPPEEGRDTQLSKDQVTEDLTAKASANIFLNVNTASIKASPNAKFSEELERATKKPPPKSTKLAVLTAPYVENNALASNSIAANVFATVLPSRSGRIFIGFPTHQTTGLSAHISAPSVIPTVERESIDLNARYVKTWNSEMLKAAGIVCRIAWSSEMSTLKDRIVRMAGGRSKVRLEDVNPMLPEAITTTQNFTFRESTPSPQICSLIENAFWTCSKSASIEVVSSCGVLPTHDVRLAPKDLSFMEGIPVLPEQLVAEAKTFVDKLIEYGLVTNVTVTDLKKALEITPLSSKQVGEFLSWLTKESSQGNIEKGTTEDLLSVAVANEEAPDGTTSRILVIGSMKYFQNASKIPVDLPVPATVMPFKYTKALSKKDLEDLGWQELQLVPWTRWLLEEAGNRNVLPETQDLTRDPNFSAQVMGIYSKQWESISQSSKSTLVDLLSSKTVIPTKLGMKIPAESYFPNVKLFDDLATFTGLNNVKDKFLLSLGVRKTVELGVVFDRLLSAEGKNDQVKGDSKAQSSHVELIQYLASVKDDIPSSDMQRLKNTPICPREGKKHNQTVDETRYKVSELFEPRPALRELGLPLLSWPGLYRSSSAEGKFLSMLGLRAIPHVTELIEIMARAGRKGDRSLRDKAIAFFLSNHHSSGYANFDYSKVTTPFLPLDQSEKLSIPSQCFVDPGAALLGFDILDRDLQSHATRFGVKMHPPMSQCVDVLLKRPPRTNHDARILFAYFAGRLSEINSTNIPRLSELNFIPTFAKRAGKVSSPKFESPKNCFLGDSDIFGDIFSYVDFGQEANAFLLKCGSKLEPTKIEVAQILVKEPARISSSFGNAEKYMSLLRSLADSISVLKKNKELFREMKTAPFLLASKELAAVPLSKKLLTTRVEDVDDLEDEDAQGIREWQLTSAQDAIIVDDYTNYNLFRTSILSAPQEESLEEFYYALGSPLLSTLVEEAARHGPRASDQKPAQKLQKQIYERSRLFLHDQPSDAIKHDTKWLEKNLQVQLVSSISLRRSLKDRNVSHVEKRSAVVTQINREYTLWISGEQPDLYQVSQALVHLLLTRPKLHSALTLEMLLKTDLLELRARGFNVSRILRQKAAEAQLAESRRQQELEAERKRIEEQQKAWQESQDKAERERSQQQLLPGGFPDSPDRRTAIESPEASSLSQFGDDRRSTRNLFSSISRQLGLRDRGSRGSHSQPQPFNQAQLEAPPPYPQDGPSIERTVNQQPVTAPYQLRENLLSAIKKTRAHNSTDIFSRGETNVVSETKSYCDEHPAHDLSFVAEIKHSIQMFLSPSTVANSSAFLSQHSAGLMVFATLLRDVAAIFSQNPRTVNIFFEPNGKTIAFNRNGSVFCNYLYFQQLHENTVLQGDTGDALLYWWVIFCHELAHNLVADHSSNHSYYTEGFVAQYFGKVAAALAQRVGLAADGSQTASANANGPAAESLI